MLSDFFNEWLDAFFNEQNKSVYVDYTQRHVERNFCKNYLEFFVWMTNLRSTNDWSLFKIDDGDCDKFRLKSECFSTFSI